MLRFYHSERYATPARTEESLTIIWPTMGDISTPLDMTKAKMNPITRRDAARLIGASTASLLLPIGASLARAANESSRMLVRAIPSSGEKLPVIGLGTWRSFDVDLTADNRKQLAEVLSLFVKLGGRVTDSSPMYGCSEQVIGELAAQLGLHQQLFLATKVWTRG